MFLPPLSRHFSLYLSAVYFSGVIGVFQMFAESWFLFKPMKLNCLMCGSLMLVPWMTFFFWQQKCYKPRLRRFWVWTPSYSLVIWWNECRRSGWGPFLGRYATLFSTHKIKTCVCIAFVQPILQFFTVFTEPTKQAHKSRTYEWGSPF